MFVSKLSVTSILCMPLVLAAQQPLSQQAGPAATQRPANIADANPQALDTRGLSRNGAYMASDIEKGDADDARRFVAYNLLAVGLTFDGYLKQYGLKCSEYLPDDKVELKLPHCEEQRRNASGDVGCVKEDEIHTQIFTDKNVFALEQDLKRRIVAESTVSLATSPSPIDLIQRTLSNMNDPGIRQSYVDQWLDPGKLVANNECESPALYRYEQNLIRFVEGQTLIPAILPLTPRPSHLRASPPLPTGLPLIPGLNYMAIDYGRFIGDVRRNAAGNQNYQVIANSVKNPHAVSRDTLGRPTLIAVEFDSQNGSLKSYSIGVVFHDGIPTQVGRWYPAGERSQATNYNFDVPNPKQVSDFLSGNYNLAGK